MKFPKDPSEITLVLANLLPMAGVLFWDWSVFEVIAVFWLENLIIGFMNILRLFALCVHRHAFSEIFSIFFFALHYGFFCFVHGGFVFIFFGDRPSDYMPGYLEMIREALAVNGLVYAASALFISHLFSLIVSFLIGGEIRHVEGRTLMGAPYARVILLHIALLAGGFILHATGEPKWAILLLAVLKTLCDLAAHRRERERLAKVGLGGYDGTDHPINPSEGERP